MPSQMASSGLCEIDILTKVLYLPKLIPSSDGPILMQKGVIAAKVFAIKQRYQRTPYLPQVVCGHNSRLWKS